MTTEYKAVNGPRGRQPQKYSKKHGRYMFCSVDDVPAADRKRLGLSGVSAATKTSRRPDRRRKSRSTRPKQSMEPSGIRTIKPRSRSGPTKKQNRRALPRGTSGNTWAMAFARNNPRGGMGQLEIVGTEFYGKQLDARKAGAKWLDGQSGNEIRETWMVRRTIALGTAKGDPLEPDAVARHSIGRTREIKMYLDVPQKLLTLLRAAVEMRAMGGDGKVAGARRRTTGRQGSIDFPQRVPNSKATVPPQPRLGQKLAKGDGGRYALLYLRNNWIVSVRFAKAKAQAIQWAQSWTKQEPPKAGRNVWVYRRGARNQGRAFDSWAWDMVGMAAEGIMIPMDTGHADANHFRIIDAAGRGDEFGRGQSALGADTRRIFRNDVAGAKRGRGKSKTFSGLQGDQCRMTASGVSCNVDGKLRKFGLDNVETVGHYGDEFESLSTRPKKAVHGRRRKKTGKTFTRSKSKWGASSSRKALADVRKGKGLGRANLKPAHTASQWRWKRA